MRTALFTPLVLLVFGGSPVVFHSCGEDPPPDVALPPPRPDAGVVCAVDADCTGGDACAGLRCLAGACVLVSRELDRDRDGVAAPPCGLDCDDGERAVHPGAEEACNGRDDDCDGVIDNDAPPTVTNRVVASLEGYSSIARFGDGFIVTVGSDARSLDRYGRVGPLFDVLGDRTIVQTETATAPDGRVLVASIIDSGSALAYAVVSPGDPPTVSPVVEISSADPVVGLAVVAHLGSFAIASISEGASGAYRLALRADITSTDPPLEVAAESDRASLASDGTSLVFPDAPGFLGFLSATGRNVRGLDGTLLRHGLASGEGFVVALTIRAERDTAARATPYDSVGGAGLALSILDVPEGLSASDETRLSLAGGHYIAARAGLASLQLAILTPDRGASQGVAMLPRTRQTPVSIADSPGMVGVLGATPSSALSTGTDLVLISDCAASP